MTKNFMWWVVEMIIWYLFFYTIIFSMRNEVNVGWIALALLFLSSFGIFASPLTRHLSFWNKMFDKVVKKEEEKMQY